MDSLRDQLAAVMIDDLNLERQVGDTGSRLQFQLDLLHPVFQREQGERSRGRYPPEGITSSRALFPSPRRPGIRRRRSYERQVLHGSPGKARLRFTESVQQIAPAFHRLLNCAGGFVFIEAFHSSGDPD